MKIVLCGYNWIGCKGVDVLSGMADDFYVFSHPSPGHVCSVVDFCERRGTPVTTEPITRGSLPFEPDLILSLYYRTIIPANVLATVNRAAVNLHPSLLPAYKGCSSLTWAMIEGERFAGYTYHHMTSRVDGGAIIRQQPIEIEPFDTQQTLYERVMFAAARALPDVVRQMESGWAGLAQPPGGGPPRPRGCPHGGEIDPEWPDEQIERFIRAMIAPPLPLATFRGRPIETMDHYRKLRDAACE